MKIIFIVEEFTQSCAWRVTRPALALMTRGHEVTIINASDVRLLERSDVSVHLRPRTPRQRKLWEICGHLTGRRVVDIDDALLEESLPSELPEAAKWDSEAQNVLKSCLAEASAVTVSVQELSDFYASFGPTPVVIPECITQEDLAIIPPQRRTRVRFFFSGGPGRQHDLKVALSALKVFLKARSEALLVLAGAPELATLARELPHGSVEYLCWRPEVLYQRAQAGCDVILAPLAKNLLAVSKSPTRLLEAGARGRPWIATPTPPYCRYKKGGIFAESLKDWEDAAMRLLDHPEERVALGEDGYAQARTFLIDDHISIWEAVYRGKDLVD